MAHVTNLIQAADSLIPFQNSDQAQVFLNQYPVDDQAALISALYIGRDHLNDNAIRAGYVPNGIPFDRFFSTGNAPRWEIDPADFARILYEKNTNLRTYYKAFERCVNGSPQIDLANF